MSYLLRPSTMDHLNAGLFYAATLGHLALVPYWLERFWGRLFSSPEERFFHAVVFGLGSLQAILHLLAGTIGIGLYAGVLFLAGLHLILFAGLAWPRPAPESTVSAAPVAPGNATSGVPQGQRKRGRTSRPVRRISAANLPWLSIVGAGVLAALVLSWLWRAPESAQILGIDARHYHAPYAINYGHGLKLFDFLATPHEYAMGASILGAWFFQPFSNVLVLDLVNLLPFLLLLASLVYLFRLLTDESGWEWVPVVFLLLFTGKMFRVSMFISADLLYAAAFAAVFTQLTAIWARNAVEPYEWWALALTTGMLLSSKIQGIMSAVLLLTFFCVALAGRYLLDRRSVPRLSVSAARLAWCLMLLLASGGIWLVRNWWYFGSPMAPAGLKIFGVTVFPGAAGQDDWLSIAKDMREVAGYNLADRFLARSREWVGLWQGIVAAGFLALAGDAAYQIVARRRLISTTQRKIFVLLFFAALLFVHGYILVFTSGTSIEILGGQTVRYIIPFFALFPLLAYACLFSNALPWVRALRLGWIVLLPFLAYLIWGYNDLSAMPVAWNRSYGREDLLDYRWLVFGFLLAMTWFLPMTGSWQRYARYASIGFVAIVSFLLVPRSVALNERVLYEARSRFVRAVDAFDRGAGGASVDDGVLYRAAAHQRRSGLTCNRSRFFTLSRFDFPVALQGPDCKNVVFNVETGQTRRPELLAAAGPGRERCDYIVAVHIDSTLRGSEYAAIKQADAEQMLGVPGALEAIGDSGLYRVYYVRPADAQRLEQDN